MCVCVGDQGLLVVIVRGRGGQAVLVSITSESAAAAEVDGWFQQLIEIMEGWEWSGEGSIVADLTCGMRTGRTGCIMLRRHDTCDKDSDCIVWMQRCMHSDLRVCRVAATPR